MYFIQLIKFAFLRHEGRKKEKRLSKTLGMDVAKPFVLLESFWFLFLLSQDLGQVKDESCSKVGGVVVNIMRRGDFHDIKAN